MTTRSSVVAQDALARARSVVLPALRAAVEALPEPVCSVVGYHFGWRDAGVGGGVGGKVVRPAVALLAAEAASAGCADAVPAAVAVELVHNFSLLHDDIMDGDHTRRHRPTAWTVYGTPAATLAGDALLNLAIHTLAHHNHPSSTAQLHTLTTAVTDLLTGQAADLSFEHQPHITYPQYRHMARHKTGALLAAAAAMGALAGGADPAQARHLHAFGEHLGLAFQYTDDLLGIWGNPTHTGKPTTTDLTRRKKTLPVVLALASDTPEATQLATYYHHTHPPTETETHRATTLLEATGARQHTQHHAHHELATALTHLDNAHLPGPTAALHDLATHLAHRTH